MRVSAANPLAQSLHTSQQSPRISNLLRIWQRSGVVDRGRPGFDFPWGVESPFGPFRPIRCDSYNPCP